MGPNIREMLLGIPVAGQARLVFWNLLYYVVSLFLGIAIAKIVCATKILILVCIASVLK